jgi:hypothetical protein
VESRVEAGMRVRALISRTRRPTGTLSRRNQSVSGAPRASPITPVLLLASQARAVAVEKASLGSLGSAEVAPPAPTT